MNETNPIFPIPLWLMVGAQFAFSYIAAALIALALVNQAGWTAALVAAVIMGMLLTATLQRSLWLLDAALGGKPLPMRGHGALSPLMKRIQSMLAQEADVSSLQKNLVRRVQETAAQQERNRLARDLHDSIKQQIFSIQMSAAAAQTRWTNDPDSALTSLDDVRRSAREAMVEMNALLLQLAPAPLEKVGLVQALRDQCEALGYRAGVEVKVDIGELPDDSHLPQGTQESVFRMAQEALSNIARHARARNVQVYLGQREEALLLDISDDGQGFDVDAVEQGMGLTNLRQRVGELNGRLDLTSAPGNGTRLQAVIPFVAVTQPQEDMVMISNPTLNRLCLTGIGGGIALIALLYYPLYVLLPGAYLTNWPRGSALLGIILQAAAALLAIGIGYTAARWVKNGSRRDNMIWGALAGMIASLIAYAGLVGAAAGAAGSAALVQHGVTPALNDADMMGLLDQVIAGIPWLIYGAFWGLLLAGISLGALGGLLVTPSDTPAAWKEIRFLAIGPLKAAVFFSALAFTVMYLFYSLLEPAIQRSVDEIGLPIPWQYVNGISLLTIGTALAVFVTLLAGLYYALRAESRGDYARLVFRQPLGVILPYVLMAWGLFLFVMNTLSADLNFSMKVVLLGGSLMALILAAGSIRLALDMRREMIGEGLIQPLTRWQIAAFTGYALGMALLPLGNVVTSIGASILVSAVLLAHRESYKTPLNVRQLVEDMAGAVRMGHFVPPLDVWGWFVLIGSFTLLILMLVSGWIIESLIIGLAVIAYLYGSAKDTPPPRPVTLQTPVHALLATITSMSLAVLAGMPMTLTLLLIAVPAIPTLASYDKNAAPVQSPPTMTELLQGHYLTHLEALLLVFVIATVLVGLGMLIRWGMFRWSTRRSTPAVG